VAESNVFKAGHADPSCHGDDATRSRSPHSRLGPQNPGAPRREAGPSRAQREAQARQAVTHRHGGGAAPQPLRWQSHWYIDSGSGLYDFRARVWSPELAAFLQPDEFGFLSHSGTLWSWPGQNPYRWRDPSGRDAEEWFLRNADSLQGGANNSKTVFKVYFRATLQHPMQVPRWTPELASGFRMDDPWVEGQGRAGAGKPSPSEAHPEPPPAPEPQPLPGAALARALFHGSTPRLAGRAWTASRRTGSPKRTPSLRTHRCCSSLMRTVQTKCTGRHRQ
jgi:RHS repeat-associated protein